MEIADLQSFLEVVRQGSLHAAAQTLHQTPSALSKAVKRLETSLGNPLFDRVGKTLRLNRAGERLRERAAELVRLAADMRAEFLGEETELHCRIAAPAILQWRYGPDLAAHMAQRYPRAAISFIREYEQDALLKVVRGDADFALVTRAAVEAGLPARVEVRPLGSMVMQLACGPTHPLAQQASSTARPIPVTSAQVLAHDFACPSVSPFCGIRRGTRADGWRDDQLPRRIRYWLDDIQVLVALVRSGRALAYIPDFALAEERLVRLTVTDCPFHCEEEVLLAWQPATAHGWHGYVADFVAMGAG